MVKTKQLKTILDDLYAGRSQAHLANDPLSFCRRYHAPEDREIAGIIASSFAYGNVKIILRTLESIFSRMGPSPRRFVEQFETERGLDLFAGFKHRFNDARDLCALLLAARTMIEEEGGHAKTITDPHAWQNLDNGKLYVANIRDGLIAADRAGKAVYEANAAKYLDQIAEEEATVKQALASLPKNRRKLITSHDAFGYFGAAHGLEIIAPEGVSTESEASAQDVAKIIRQIKAEHVPAVFMENITDHRLLDQIARETGAKIGGELYTDALSPADGPAPSYLDMFRHNVGALTAAMSS